MYLNAHTDVCFTFLHILFVCFILVRSFGTEDRETTHPVPAQNQVYDYILFRATDIKDISVIPSQQLLYDPAIVQVIKREEKLTILI